MTLILHLNRNILVSRYRLTSVFNSIECCPTSISDDDSISSEDLKKHDNLAAISSVALFFSVLFIFSVFET